PVYITDVCDVLDDWEDEETYAEINKQGAVLVTVRKQSRTNTVAVRDALMERMEDLRERIIPKDIEYQVVFDQSPYIRDNVADVWNTIIFGGLLALFITYMFLGNLRATIIGGLCIPTSVISTFFLMKVMGFTLNNMSLMALSLAVGMLIDDAIVLIENVFRHMEKGEKPKLAAENATVELALAIMATSLVLLAVFVPIGSMGEMVGEYFKQFGLTVAFAVAFSTMTAYTLTPMVAAHWLDEKSANPEQGRNKYLELALKKFNAGFDHIRVFYDELINLALANPVKVIIVGVLAMVVNFGLTPFIGVENQPTYDSGQFSIDYKSPIGTSLQKTVSLAREVEDKVLKHPEVDIASLYIGGTRNPVNTGSMFVKLKPSGERDKSMQTLMDELRAELRSVEGLQINVLSNQGLRRGRPVQCGLRGNDYKLLREYALQLADLVRKVKGATDVDISDSDQEPEIKIKIDRVKAAALGLNSSDIGSQVGIGFMGKDTANSYTIGDNDYDVVLQMAAKERMNMEDVKNFRISSANGEFIRLGDVAEITLDSGPTRIEREDKQRQVVVYANTVGISPGDLINIIEKDLIKQLNMPQGYSYKMIGEAQDMAKMFREVFKALILAVVCVYMVLAAEFESYIQPLIIMVSLPFSIIGGVVGLLVAGQTANMMSMIGLTMLLGLASKNAILLIDYANQRREDGLSIKEAVLEACSTRLRPIFMTTFSTILAMLPVAFGLGQGAELRQSMGVVIVGGLFSSTMLTLLVIPVLYLLVENWQEKRKKKLVQ
ncbi:MAG: efflux RND transporter permease subunit, partial [Acidaminococcaceae bacterium]|nr:efflux RND transporter permease subunit [Acidaminococcaceae bacterium]